MRVTLLEAREGAEIHGRTSTREFPAVPVAGLPAAVVDLGANYVRTGSARAPHFDCRVTSVWTGATADPAPYG